MKIKKLSIQNFRSHRDLTIEEIPRFLIVTGRNSCGKTSILDAITWALAGANQYTDSKGGGSSCLIMDGETKALANLTVETGQENTEHTIKRSIPHAISVDGSKGGVRRAEELLRVLLAPVKPQSFFLTMNPERILKTMSDGERRKFLSEMVGVTNRDDVQKIADLAEWLPTIGVQTDSAVAREASRIFVGSARKDYGTFYGLRRDNNVRISTLEAQIKDLPAPQGEENPSEQLARIAKRLVLLDIEDRMAERMDGKAGTAVITKPDTEKIRAKLDNLRVIHANIQKIVAAKEQRVALYDSQKAQVLSAAKQCPVFARGCPLTKEEISESIAATDTLKGRESRELLMERKKADQAADAIEKAEKELEQAKEQMEKYKELWAGDSITIDQVRPRTEIAEEVTSLKDRAEALRKYEAELAAYNANEGVRAALARAKTEKDPLELLVQAFAPAGIPSMLLQEHLPRLEQLATAASRIITRNRYEIVFSAVDGELDISVISEGRKRPIHTLSTSEVVWVSLVLQHVVNRLSGSDLLVLDEASILDETIQEGLQDFLLAEDLGYQNVILCATTEEENFLPRLVGDSVRRVRL